MSKILLDIKDSNFPKDEDIIVYNGKLKCWEVICKDQYLKSFRDEIKKMKEENQEISKKVDNFIEEIKNKFKEAKEEIKEIAKITKEGIK